MEIDRHGEIEVENCTMNARIASEYQRQFPQGNDELALLVGGTDNCPIRFADR